MNMQHATLPSNRIHKRKRLSRHTEAGAGTRLMKGLETMSRCSHSTPMPIGASNSAVRRLQIKNKPAILERKNRINNIARDVSPSGRVAANRSSYMHSIPHGRRLTLPYPHKNPNRTNTIERSRTAETAVL